MRVLAVSLFIFLISGSCRSRTKDKEDITIIGHVKGLPGKVFLAEAHAYNTFLDSTVCVNDDFVFHLNSKNFVQPFMATIAYWSKDRKISTFNYFNHIRSTADQGYINDAFMLEKGITRMRGAVETRLDSIMGTHIHFWDDSIHISAGEETDAFYRIQMIQFGYMDADITKRSAQLDTFISIIKKYPGSEFLLSQIDESKSVIKKAELSLMLKTFNADALKTKTGKKLEEYLAKKVYNPFFENLLLEDKDAKPVKIFDTTAKVNMLIIWASWCGPCRQEIPEIKKLFENYSKKGLSVTNISIDDSKESWQGALKIEKMYWKQLIVPAGIKQTFNTAFEVGSIPYVIFTDSKGKLLTRFIGFDKTNIDEYKKIIDARLQSSVQGSDFYFNNCSANAR